MNTQLIRDLRDFEAAAGVSIVHEAEHVQFMIVRSQLRVAVVIPRNVLEVFIEVRDTRTGGRIKDWFDYAGYDEAPLPLLADDMRADVLQFIRRLLSRELRMAEAGRVLEWRAGERWAQAVPFVPDVEPRSMSERSRN